MFSSPRWRRTFTQVLLTGLALISCVSVAMSQAQSNAADLHGYVRDPNGAGLPAWPTFTAKDQRVMYFDGISEARPLPNAAQLKALDQYFAERRAPQH